MEKHAVRILIIDDEVEVASLLAQAVQLAGHEPVVAHDGQEGLVLLSKHQPDLVLLDLVMPEMDGVEVLRRIRMTNRTLPVIIVTGNALSYEVGEARRLGVTGVIAKPSFLTQLRDALAGVQSQPSSGGSAGA